VNTIFIDEADRYGLADLHQLRGRVGRYKHQAYCYLVLPGGRSINPEAQKRVQALVEYSDLGSGFQIAMKDLEIRGAGNILGPEQSGHIAAVGYDMYCRLLEKAVRALRNEAVAEPVQVEVDLALKAFVPDEYRSGEPAKFEVYRRVAAAGSLAAVDDLSRELEDRFGPYPGEVECLLDVQRLRLLATERGVEYVGREEGNLVLRGNQKMQELFAACPARVAILDGKTAAVSLVDPRRRYPPPVSDDKAFRVALEWLRTGAFPGPAGRLKDPSPRADRVASQCDVGRRGLRQGP
jgi:transcription-repair coupling factor (superfamily II helicase)